MKEPRVTNTLDQIYHSPAYLNVVTAMNRVFGEQGWRVNSLWPSGNTNDFEMAVDIDNVSRAAYIAVGDTHEHGMYACGPGGSVSVYAPLATGWKFIFADDSTGDSVRHLEGTEEEQDRYEWGANGTDLPAITGYVQILKRYLDKKKSDDENAHNT